MDEVEKEVKKTEEELSMSISEAKAMNKKKGELIRASRREIATLAKATKVPVLEYRKRNVDKSLLALIAEGTKVSSEETEEGDQE